MTELFRDDCSTFNKWAQLNAASSIVAARNGNGFQVSGATAALGTTIPAQHESDTITVGFAYRRTDSSTSVHRILNIYSDGGSLEHNRLNYTPSSTTLAFTRGSTNIASNSAVTFTTNTWYYIELQTKLHDTTGFVIVRINGTEVINLTALDTRNGGTKTTIDTFMFQAALAAGVMQVDDVYFKVGAGETFLGDPGAVTTTTPTTTNYRQSLRVARKPDGAQLARQALRVAYNLFTTEGRLARLSNRVLTYNASPEAQLARVSLRSLTTAAVVQAQLARLSLRSLTAIVAAPPGVTTKVWSGSAFVDAPIRVWNGSAFVDAVAVKTWNGSAFL